MLTAAGSLSITRQDPFLPQAPSYEQSEADAQGKQAVVSEDWIRGTYAAKRNLMVLHNPNQNGGHSDLDERQSGFVPGIGVYDLKLFSDVVSCGSMYRAVWLKNASSPSVDPYTPV
jgi:hypothetical protein